MTQLEDLAQEERLLALLAELLPLATRHRGDRDDEEAVHQVLLKAGTVPPPETTAPRTVFELGYSAEAGPVRVHRYCVGRISTGFDTSASAPPGRAVNIVACGGDRVHVSGLAYPGNRWTAEKAEAERRRRAKQIVPKPSFAAGNFSCKRKPREAVAA